MATEYVIDGPLRLDAPLSGTASTAGITLGDDAQFDMYTRSNADPLTGTLQRIEPPSGPNGTYTLEMVRSGGPSSNAAPLWTLSTPLNNNSISVVHGSLTTASATAIRIGDTGTGDWTAVSPPFFNNVGTGFDFKAGAGGGLYTVPVTAEYEVMATVTWNNASVNRGSRILRILIDGLATGVPQASSLLQAPSDLSINLSQNVVALLSLTAGQTLSIEVEQGSDTSVDVLTAHLGIRNT